LFVPLKRLFGNLSVEVLVLAFVTITAFSASFGVCPYGKKILLARKVGLHEKLNGTGLDITAKSPTQRWDRQGVPVPF